jgi:hypothetical protein
VGVFLVQEGLAVNTTDLTREEREQVALGLILLGDLLMQRAENVAFKRNEPVDWVAVKLPVVEMVHKLGISDEWGKMSAQMPPTEIGKKYE